MDAGLCSSSGALVQHTAPAQSAHHQPCGCDYGTDVIMSAMGCKFLWARPLRSHETAGAQTTRSARSTTGTSNTTSDTSGICWIRRRNSSAPATTSTWSRCVFPGRVSGTGRTGIFSPWLLCCRSRRRCMRRSCASCGRISVAARCSSPGRLAP